ncbi:MAG: DUF4124 domain-containing protein, partial [Acidovorax sp.]|uniref:DUF4124 domain-containing protein n=1 Tax=Acidovorax sp. TaxID=1872122 RepID=UPI002633580C
ICLCVFGTATASAQVHRCKDATGKLVFSDRPCEASQSGELVQRKRTREEILKEREQAGEAEIRKQNQRLAEQERALSASQRGVPAPQAPVPRHSGNDWQKRKDLENAATSAGSIANNGGRWDQNAEAERARVRREEALRHQAANPPSMITNCNGGFCYDTNGNVYNRNGSFLNRTDGQTCTMQAGYAHCN